MSGAREQVHVQLQHSYRIPARCWVCGCTDLGGSGHTREARVTRRAPASKSTFTLTYPVCAACNDAADRLGSAVGWGALIGLATGAALLVLALAGAFSRVSALGYLALIGVALVLVGTGYYAAAAVARGKSTSDTLERMKLAENACTISVPGFMSGSPTLLITFGNPSVARAFREANSDLLLD